MNEKIVYWVSVVLSGAAVLVFISNIFLVTNSHELRQKVNQRQANINNAASLSQFNQSLVSALADETVKNNDSDIRNLLSSQGIKITENPPANNKFDKELRK